MTDFKLMVLKRVIAKRFAAIPPRDFVQEAERDRALERLLPDTFFADRTPLERVERIVAAWRRAIEVNHGLEDELAASHSDNGVQQQTPGGCE